MFVHFISIIISIFTIRIDLFFRENRLLHYRLLHSTDSYKSEYIIINEQEDEHGNEKRSAHTNN